MLDLGVGGLGDTKSILRGGVMGRPTVLSFRVFIGTYTRP